MAGFGYRNTGRVDLRVVPHPAVTLVLDWGNGPHVVDNGSGRQQHGALVAGLAPDATVTWSSSRR
jgi:hypothetical protein